VLSALRMSIEIVFEETYDVVRDALTASLGEAGFRVGPSPLPPGMVIDTKTEILRAERGNPTLSKVLPFVFKTEALAAVVSAYVDGTTGVTVREDGAHGGYLASGVVATAGLGGGGILGGVASTAGRMAASGVDQLASDRALGKHLARVDALLRTRLAGRIAYEGPVKPGVRQVSV
jgi:hypothetical protein